jgi:hypothetical protein
MKRVEISTSVSGRSSEMKPRKGLPRTDRTYLPILAKILTDSFETREWVGQSPGIREKFTLGQLNCDCRDRRAC